MVSISTMEGNSTSTPLVESNETPPPATLDSSQAQTDTNPPIDEVSLDSDGEEILTKSHLRSRGMVMMGVGKRKFEAYYTFDQDYARRQLANMIIMHEYPLSMVEHVGFRRYSQALQPLFHVVSRDTIRKDILKIYDVEREKTMKVLEKNQSRVAVTTDMWTSGNQKRGFMVIAAHFIDDSWKLQSRILRFVYVPCPHTAEGWCEALIGTFLEWNIDRKLSTLTVDNCSTNDAMIPLLLDKFDNRSYSWRSLFHVRCATHILHLIAKDGLEVIKSSIEKIRESAAFWTATPKREEKFEEALRQLNIVHGKKLSLDCATRWTSTFLMLQTAIEYKDAFSRLEHCDSQYKCLPNTDDWKLATEICGRLQIFYDVTELFSGTKYPTSNLFFAEVCHIKLELSKWVVCDNDVVNNMASRMVERYNKYWDAVHVILGVAAVLDPRYKMTLIEYYFSEIGSCLKIEDIRTHCLDLLAEYQKKDTNSGDESSSKAASTFGGEYDLADFDIFVLERKKAKNLHKKSEFDQYLEEDVLPRNQDFDILAWWKFNGWQYPTLQAIARDLLAVPVSTFASEPAFSTSGRVVSPNRRRLRPETLEALMCAQNWLFALEHGGDPTMQTTGFATVNDDEVDVDDGVPYVTNVDDE